MANVISARSKTHKCYLKCLAVFFIGVPQSIKFLYDAAKAVLFERVSSVSGPRRWVSCRRGRTMELLISRDVESSLERYKTQSLLICLVVSLRYAICTWPNVDSNSLDGTNFMQGMMMNFQLLTVSTRNLQANTSHAQLIQNMDSRRAVVIITFPSRDLAFSLVYQASMKHLSHLMAEPSSPRMSDEPHC